MPKQGLRSAINNKCKECIFDPNGGGGTWRQQVEACTVPNCPLYEVRPISKPHNNNNNNLELNHDDARQD